MKRITCNLCGNLLQTELTKEQLMFIVKVKSPFCDVKSFKAHICEDCFDDFCRYLKIIGGDAND